jgi:hypothetical protein
MGFAINPAEKISSKSIGSAYIKNISNIATYRGLGENYRLLYLCWLAEGKTSNSVPQIFPILYFRNLQYRAVAEEQDKKIVLLEVLRLFSLFRGNSGYIFLDYMLQLAQFLLLTIDNSEWTEEETAQLMDFLASTKFMPSIRRVYHSLVAKVQAIPPTEYLQLLFKTDSPELFLKNFWQQLCYFDYKEHIGYYNFNKSYFQIKLKGIPVLYTIFLQLVEEREIDLLKELSLENAETKALYENYYLPNRHSKLYSFQEMQIKIGTKARQALYDASFILSKYEKDKEDFVERKKKNLSSQDRHALLPENLKKFFPETPVGKKKSKIAPVPLVVPVKLNLDSKRLLDVASDTKAIQSILQDVFVENLEEEIVLAAPTPNQNADGLEIKIADFVVFLSTKEIWETQELLAYCKQHKLMLNDVLSTINEYYDDKCGEYLITEEAGKYQVAREILD